MSNIYNKIRDYIIIINYNKEIVFCNNSFFYKFGYNEEDILGLNIDKLINDKNSITIPNENNEINKHLYFYSKSKILSKVDVNISIDYFNNEKSIFIIGKDSSSKLYTIEMLEDLLDNINIATYILNTDGQYAYVNKDFTNILNKNREDIIGTNNNDHFESNTYYELEKNNKEVFNNKSPKIFNEKVIVDDTIHWYKSYKAPIVDKNNNIKYIIGASKNINLSKTISEELYKNYNRTIIDDDFNNNNDMNLNKILSNIGEHILDYTQADGLSILLYNKEKKGLVPAIKLKKSKIYLKNVDFIPIENYKNIYGYRKYFNCIFPTNNMPNLQTVKFNNINEVSYSGNYTIELCNELIGFIGLSYSNNNAPKFNSDEYMKYICNKIAMIIKNIRLANEVYIENKKRKYTEKELEQYLDISVDLVAIIDREGYLKRLSSSWSNVLGWSEEELLSMSLTDIIHPQELEEFKKGKKPEDIEGKNTRNVIRFRHKNGNYIYLEWSSRYLGDERIYVTTAIDITRKLEAEKEKRRLENAVKVEVVKNEFFSNISHEFRTPINIILGTMQVINKNIEQKNIQLDSLKKHTNYIKQNSYRLLKLVNNLIDISKMDIGMYELRCSNQNIISIIEDITLSVAEYTKNNKINLIFDTDKEEVITYCDPDKIERIILNLLSNAIKYTPENGFIEVKINSQEDEVIVSVRDSGVGIPKNKLDIIFDRFGQVDDSFNRKCEGSGIGLSLVKNLVEMHEGRIKVNSKVNEGSEFIFSIPIKVKEENNFNEYNNDRKCKHVERCDIEFSDIYSI